MEERRIGEKNRKSRKEKREESKVGKDARLRLSRRNGHAIGAARCASRNCGPKGREKEGEGGERKSCFEDSDDFEPRLDQHTTPTEGRKRRALLALCRWPKLGRNKCEERGQVSRLKGNPSHHKAEREQGGARISRIERRGLLGGEERGMGKGGEEQNAWTPCASRNNTGGTVCIAPPTKEKVCYELRRDFTAAEGKFPHVLPV